VAVEEEVVGLGGGVEVLLFLNSRHHKY